MVYCLIKVLEAKEVELFEEDEIMVVEFAENLPLGVGILCVAFDGTLNDRMKGFYRRLVPIFSSYVSFALLPPFVPK